MYTHVISYYYYVVSLLVEHTIVGQLSAGRAGLSLWTWWGQVAMANPVARG